VTSQALSGFQIHLLPLSVHQAIRHQRRALVPLCFCEEEKLAHNEEFNISPYKVTCLHQEDQAEVTKDFYSSSFLISLMNPYALNP